MKKGKSMNKTLAIEMLKDIKKGIMPCDMTDICDYSINCIEPIGCLKERPCEACIYHGDDGCKKWDCVFDELLYEGSIG